MAPRSGSSDMVLTMKLRVYIMCTSHTRRSVSRASSVATTSKGMVIGGAALAAETKASDAKRAAAKNWGFTGDPPGVGADAACRKTQGARLESKRDHPRVGAHRQSSRLW